MRLFGVSNLQLTAIFLISAIGMCSSELRLVMSIFRHGDRYPLPYSITKLFFPLNLYSNIRWLPNSAGGLTLDGKRRSYQLGNILRDKYGEWFENRYSRKIVDFVTGRVERTINTASLVAAGLFRTENGSQRWNPTLNWQPVPIRLVDYPENAILFGNFLCTKYWNLLKKTKLEDPLIVEYNARMKTLYDYVSRNVGGSVDNKALNCLYMELKAGEGVGLKPPIWAEEIFRNGTLEKAASMDFVHSSWNDGLKRVTGGVLLKTFLENVDSLVESANSKWSRNEIADDKRALFYSGHDSNVAGIMNALGIFYPHVPNYASAVILELHNDENRNFYVKVSHRDSGEFKDYVLPGCEAILCPLDKIRKFFESMSFDFARDCGTYRKV